MWATNLTKLTISLAFLLGIIGCDSFDFRVRIENKSNKDIYFIWSNDTVIAPAVLGTVMDGNIHESDWRRIPVNSGQQYGGLDSWETVFKFDPDYTQHLFIFYEETLKNHPWDTIEKYSLFDQRIDLTLEDIEKSDWKIVVE